MFAHLFIQVWALSAVALTAAAKDEAETLPIIDLGYAIHKPSFDAQNDLYTYKNIRYADPPLGELRFRHPVPVSSVNRTINDGQYGFGCRQGYPSPVVDELSREGESKEQARLRLTNNPLWSEDCLFLNVVVPKPVLERTQSKQQGTKKCRDKKGAPVAVWIYGGAHLMGFKDQSDYDPVGLLARAREDGGDGMIHVAMNYRLGLFGFVHAGIEEKRIDSNAGQLDQRLALQWVKDNIHLFGGDPSRVTVMGQSAGAASIMFHLTAEGGKAKSLFQNAIIQSPGYTTRELYDGWAITLDVATRVAGRAVTDGPGLAALSEEELREVNSLAVYELGATTGPYGLTPDGVYIVDWAGAHLLRGEFDHTPNVIVGHTRNETLPYFAEGAEQVLSARDIIGMLLGSLSDEVLDYVQQELYPPPDQTTPYSTAFARLHYLATDLGFACFARQLSSAYANETYSYQFDVKPAVHSQDLLYHFYGNEESQGAGVDADAALALQRYWTQFVLKGVPGPGSGDSPKWPLHTKDSTLMRFVEGGAVLEKDDPGAHARCLFWQKVASGEIS